jgi:glycine/D-amino acid oxidase-like deaminating enzyme
LFVGIGSAKRGKRVAVIGVGIIGASVGWNLSQHGAEVVIIDAGQPGEGATNWSFSWVNASAATCAGPTIPRLRRSSSRQPND